MGRGCRKRKEDELKRVLLCYAWEKEDFELSNDREGDTFASYLGSKNFRAENDPKSMRNSS